jgi:hypothetical protein
MENKTGKYIKYAIGEIVLVVIGILIALSINNWNEQRKLQKEDLQLCKQLLEDALADSLFFKSRSDYLIENKKNVQYIYEKPELRVADSIILSNVEGSNLIFTLGLRYLSNVVTNNEKAIQDIQSASIKNELRRYALQYDYVAAALQRMNNILEQEMNPFQKKYAEHMRLMVSTNSVELLNEIYNDKDFQNSIHLIYGYFDDSIRHLATFETNSHGLIKVLRERINREK